MFIKWQRKDMIIENLKLCSGEGRGDREAARQAGASIRMVKPEESEQAPGLPGLLSA